VKFTDGTISSLSGIRDEPNTFQISVPIQPGNSGGPLVNREGVVIGVVVAKLSATAALNSGSSIPEAVNYAVKSNYLLELVDRDSNIGGQIHQQPKLTKDLPLPDLVSKAEQSIVFIVATVPARSSGDAALRVAVDPTYRPFTFKDQSGRPTGFDVEIAKAICGEIKRQCIFVEQDWDSMFPGLQSRKYDAIISSMSITESRMKHVDFTDRYYKTPSFLVLRKGTLYTGPESIKGKKIGVLKNSPQEKFSLGELTPAGVEVLSYEDQNQVYFDISEGRLDGTVADYVEVSGGFLNKSAGKDFKTFEPPLYTPKYFGVGAGIAIRKGESELQEELNAAIKALRSNGVYKSINDKYFGLDVYGY
jgi:arginine/ornithine transport system substrate-binding protein